MKGEIILQVLAVLTFGSASTTPLSGELIHLKELSESSTPTFTGTELSDSNESTNKIIQGRDVPSPGRYPYQISIQSIGSRRKGSVSRFCGGTIIRPDWILTAAHCINTTEPGLVEKLIVVGGVVKAHCHDDATGQTRRVERFIVHEEYDENIIKSDLALLKLQKPFVMTPYVNYAALPSKDFQPYGSGYITGWGRTGDEKKDLCAHLQVGHVPITSYDACQKHYWPIMNNDTICVGVPQATASSCGGDSGGALTMNVKIGRALLVGVCSYGMNVCTQYPSVYVNVAVYREWIDRSIQESG